MGTHVASVKSASDVVLRSDSGEAGRQPVIFQEFPGTGLISDRVVVQVPADPVRSTCRVIIRQGEELLFHQEVVSEALIVPGVAGVAHQQVVFGRNGTGKDQNGRRNRQATDESSHYSILSAPSTERESEIRGHHAALSMCADIVDGFENYVNDLYVCDVRSKSAVCQRNGASHRFFANDDLDASEYQ
jgi:hypothetical protein